MKEVYCEMIEKLYGRPAKSTGDDSIYLKRYAHKRDRRTFDRDYVLYQLSCFSRNVENNKLVPFQFICSDTAFKRWDKRKAGYKYHIAQFCKQFNLEDGKAYVMINNDDSIRMKFYNQEKGLTNCLKEGIGYNSEVELCLSCNHSAECERLTK